MVLMSHIREASKVTVNSSYFHPIDREQSLEEMRDCRLVMGDTRIFNSIPIPILNFSLLRSVSAEPIPISIPK